MSYLYKGIYLDYELLIGIDEYDNTSFFVIVGPGYNPIQFINSYASGTKFGIFEELIVDDDGRFYGIEYQNSTRRFVMLNNILAKINTQPEYKVILRQSYNLPASLQSGTINKLIKKPVANRYLFCGTTTSEYPLAVELTINVGEPNEWTEYTYTTDNGNIKDAWASWDEDDNLTYKIMTTYISGGTGTLDVLYNNNGVMSLLNQFTLPDPTASLINISILNNDSAYLSYCNTDGNGVYNQYLYTIGNSLTQLYVSSNEDVADATYMMKSILYNDGINVYLSYNLPKVNNEVEYHMGIIFNGSFYDNNFGILDYTTSQSLYSTNTFHQFNLYNYYLQLGDVCYVSSSIFNNLEYNGLSYNAINGLVPNSAVLYASYDIPIFAREIYNKTVSNNTTVSSVEIPNTMINLQNIAKQSLYSETNNNLVNNIESIITNVYETVDINFYNTIYMKDSNEPTNEISNINGASRINNSVSQTNDYTQTQATKIKINYTDNTNYIIAINPDNQITMNNGVATYSFMIYSPTDKQIDNLEIISYDEQTHYATINGTFTQGKYYQITQDVYVE